MPDNSESTATLAADAAIAASLLGIGRGISLASGMILAIATGFWLLGQPIRPTPFFCGIALSLLQVYFAQRVRFDSEIFGFWARRWNGAANPAEDLEAFDSRVGRKPSSASSVQADLEQRKRGAMRLLRNQSLSATAQLLCMAIALWPPNQVG